MGKLGKLKKKRKLENENNIYISNNNNENNNNENNNNENLNLNYSGKLIYILFYILLLFIKYIKIDSYIHPEDINITLKTLNKLAQNMEIYKLPQYRLVRIAINQLINNGKSVGLHVGNIYIYIV